MAWQRAHELALVAYQLTESFSRPQTAWLAHQLRRASFSGAANLVEGSGRPSAKERRRFSTIAHTSMQEVAYGLEYARDLNLTSDEAWTATDDLARRASFLTWRLLKAC